MQVYLCSYSFHSMLNIWNKVPIPLRSWVVDSTPNQPALKTDLCHSLSCVIQPISFCKFLPRLLFQGSVVGELNWSSVFYISNSSIPLLTFLSRTLLCSLTTGWFWETVWKDWNWLWPSHNLLETGFIIIAYELAQRRAEMTSFNPPPHIVHAIRQANCRNGWEKRPVWFQLEHFPTF